jgi:hypothetical protein
MQGFGVCFCSHQAFVLWVKNHDKPAAAAGKQGEQNYWQRVD